MSYAKYYELEEEISFLRERFTVVHQYFFTHTVFHCEQSSKLVETKDIPKHIEQLIEEAIEDNLHLHSLVKEYIQGLPEWKESDSSIDKLRTRYVAF